MPNAGNVSSPAERADLPYVPIPDEFYPEGVGPGGFDPETLKAAADAHCRGTYHEMTIKPWVVRYLLSEDWAQLRCRAGGLVVLDKQQAETVQKAGDRLAYLADSLHAMIPREVWRDQGADDMQGHYEGDYWAEQTLAEAETKRQCCYGNPDCTAKSHWAGALQRPETKHECQRCGSDKWTDVDYSGCSECREPAEREQEIREASAAGLAERFTDNGVSWLLCVVDDLWCALDQARAERDEARQVTSAYYADHSEVSERGEAMSVQAVRESASPVR